MYVCVCIQTLWIVLQSIASELKPGSNHIFYGELLVDKHVLCSWEIRVQMYIKSSKYSAQNPVIIVY